ncbi:unnamed protein product [Owenia fusiformis]|uniref:Phosphatidylinositol-4,5-bisphosphate 4-phosphatase n=1 Tax=Owenia fusiformis TaxID=6347 RepID=A0A8J1UN69_OWEFU|nr:unnamed protein product [Owenia fusiformis]
MTIKSKMADGGESAPLLKNEANTGSPPTYSTEPGSGVTGQPNVTGSVTVTVAPIGPEDLPPPYTPAPQGGIPTINCKICQSVINIEGKTHQHVVKCNVCNEATPIKAPPPGKKYVRCPCNCLLICKGTSQRIACPRADCKRIINLGPLPNTVAMRSPGSSRIICAHCEETFLFNILNNALARCPHCRKVSSVGPNYARNRAIYYNIIGIIFLALGIGVTVGTYEAAKQQGGIYVAWIGAFVIGIVMMIRGIYFACMKVSTVEGPA